MRNSGPLDKRGNMAPRPPCVEKHSITWHLREGPHQVTGLSPPPEPQLMYIGAKAYSKIKLSHSLLLYFLHLQSQLSSHGSLNDASYRLGTVHP